MAGAIRCDVKSSGGIWFAVLCGGVAVLVAAVASWSVRSRHDAPTVATVLPQTYVARTVVPVRSVADFTLTDQDGRPFRFSDSNGRIRLLYFGYTSCPDICPTTLAKWRTVKRKLGGLGDDIQFIMVTVDPDVDRPAQMKRYVQLFDPSFVGLTGTVNELTPVWNAFNVHPKRYSVEVPGAPTLHIISHPASVYVVDKGGKLRLEILFAEKADEIVQDIERLMGRTS